MRTNYSIMMLNFCVETKKVAMKTFLTYDQITVAAYLKTQTHLVELKKFPTTLIDEKESTAAFFMKVNEKTAGKKLGNILNYLCIWALSSDEEQIEESDKINHREIAKLRIQDESQAISMLQVGPKNSLIAVASLLSIEVFDLVNLTSVNRITDYNLCLFHMM